MDTDTAITGASMSEQEREALGYEALLRATRQVLKLFGFPQEDFSIIIADNESDIGMLAETLRNDPARKAIVFCKPSQSIHANLLVKIFKYPNVRFLNLDKPDIISILNDFASEDAGTGRVGEMGVNDAKGAIVSHVLSILNHDLGSIVRFREKAESKRKSGDFPDESHAREVQEKYDRIIAKARELFEINPRVSDANVEVFIMQARRSVEKVMDGFIEGVYCDIDDTLIDSNGAVIRETVERLERYEAEGKPVFIWTGGDIGMAKEKLERAGLGRFTLLSKFDFAGATAEIVIDNVSPQKFHLQTRISAKTFIRVG